MIEEVNSSGIGLAVDLDVSGVPVTIPNKNVERKNPGAKLWMLLPQDRRFGMFRRDSGLKAD